MKENETRFVKLEQSDKEKAELIAELNCDVGKIKQEQIAINVSVQDGISSHVISENLENLEETVTNLSRSDYVYTNTSKVSGLEQNDETDVVDTSQIIVQGLIQELIQNQCEVTCQTDSISSDDKINKSCIQDMENLISDFAE
ncbi:3857_t:CDS:2, partial [Funneliformis geosporum]